MNRSDSQELDISRVSSGKTSFSLSNVPIKHRLPLLIGCLLLGMIALSIWASYRGVKESALEAGSERLRSLTEQLANQSQQSLPITLNRTFTVANDPAVRNFLSLPSSQARTAAVLVLQKFAPDQDTSSLQVELWNSSGAAVLVVPENSPQSADLSAEFRQSSIEPFKSVGPIRVVKDQVLYTVVAAVKDDSGKPAGYLVRWRRVVPTANIRKQLSELLGSDAALFYGNTTGDVWTDLEKAVSKPPVALGSTLEVTHYTRDGNSVMAMGRPISGTPWFILVEFPERVFLVQANRFLRRMLLIGIVLLGVGVAITFLVSRSITRPLHSLTEAASAMSVGDYSPVVDLRRNDELGALGNAFNLMVVKVRDSQGDLESRIDQGKRTEEDLRRSEERLQTVIDNLAEGLVVSQLDGQLISWNRAALDMHGYDSIEECLLRIPAFAQTFELRTLDGEILEVEKWPLQQVIDGQLLRDLEVCVKRKDSDSRRFFSYSGALVSERSGKRLAFVTINDITDKRQAEMELKTKSEELAVMTQQLWQSSKLATMGELSASIAHELNNPLATVALRAEMLIEKFARNEPQRKSAEIILNEIERMARLVESLLEFSRRSHRQTSTVDVAEEISNSVNFISYFLRNRNITILHDFRDGLPSIQADRQQLRQLFLNLLTNATDAMPDGGTLITRTHLAELAGARAVQIEFIDSGAGIPPENLKRIWESFFTTKPAGKGTGLGLAICRRIIEEHGGEISIDSTVGAGTTVRIKLPATSATSRI